MLERPIYTFDDPFCPEAERNYFYDLLERVVTFDTYKRQHLCPPQPMIIRLPTEANQVHGRVVWKRGGWGEHTGLCIDGKAAGFLVYDTNIEQATAERPLTIDGGGFNVNKAIQNLNIVKLPEDVRAKVQSLLHTSKDDVYYPHLIVVLLKALSYPVDEVKFLENIKTGTCHFMRRNQQRLREIESHLP